MKVSPKNQLGLAIIAGIALTSLSLNAGQVVVSTFDTDTDATAWAWESWSNPATTEFDPTRNAGGGAPGSGSLRVINNFPNSPGGYSQAVITGPLGGTFDAETLYTNISFDIKLDPSSYPRVNGVQYGGIEMILRQGGNWDWTDLGYVGITSSFTNWTHLNFPIKAPASQIHHLTLKLGENNLTNTVIYNIDNIKWDEAPRVLPPPVMGLEKTAPGLNFVAAGDGQYDRQSIQTVDSFGWIGSSAPMSYSMTIKEFPSGASYGGFTAHWYLAPGTPGNEDSPDWNEANCILIDIRANANGSGTATYHYKTNAPGSNGRPTYDNATGQYFNASPTNGPVGQIGSVTGASILGTWTVSVNQDTNWSLIAPDGTTSSFVMPPEDAAQFAGDAKIYFGVVPGQPGNIGQKAILSHAQIKSGSTVLLDDDFSTSPLDPLKWVVRAHNAGGVNMIAATDLFYVSWTTPASGFILQTNSNLASPNNWADPGLTDQLVGTKRRVLVNASALPSADKGFFRLLKRVASKLQVLVPDETAAPGTPNGKTGSPSTVSLGVGGAVDVTVNSVDATWYPVTSVADTVHLTISPADPLSSVPADGALANGTGVFTVTFGTPGTYTITATDVSNNTVSAGASATITVIP